MLGVCVIRVFWLLVIVPRFPSVTMVEVSYPITWTISSVMFVLYYFKSHWLERRIMARVR